MSLLLLYARREGRLPWGRLWTPRGERLDEDGQGFLAEPARREFMAPQNIHLRSLDQLDDVGCVLALGDPGLGKSWAIEEYAHDLDERLRRPGVPQSAHLVAVAGDQFDSRQSLVDRVFRHPEVEAWRAENGLLYLIIDGLDETPSELTPLCNTILSELEDLPVERLRLRISCRTAVLPEEFRAGLVRRFARPLQSATDVDASNSGADSDRVPAGPDSRPDESQAARASGHGFLEVEIAHLTKDQARLYAVHRLESDAAAERFLANVEAIGAGPFAARPLTLKALLERFAAGRELTRNQVELFRDLCTELCNPKPPRPGAMRVQAPRRTPRERYRLAGRICAGLLLGNRRSIWLGARRRADDTLLNIADLTGLEHVDGVDFRVDEPDLWEAVDTGLFTGLDELGAAAHRAFAEFMAAEWIAARDLSLRQITGLLTDPLDRNRRTVPQLRQVMAWLATLRPDVLGHIAKTEPEVILWSDVVHLPEAGRPAVVDGLLERTTANLVENPPFGVTPGLNRLAHGALANQLAGIVENRDLPPRTRDLALDIAYACRLAGVLPATVRLALDDREPIDLRYAAARVVAAAGDDHHKRLLLPLLAPVNSLDEMDNLRGAVLLATWPLVPPEHLFPLLTPPLVPNYGGAYGAALMRIADNLTPAYVRAGVLWLASDERRGHYVDEVIRRVFRLALDELEDSSILNGLAAYVRRSIEAQHPLLEDGRGRNDDVAAFLATTPAIRRKLLEAVIDQGVASPHLLYYITDEPPRLVLPEDTPWALERLTALPQHDQRRKAWLHIVRTLFDPWMLEHMEAAFAHKLDADVSTASNGWNEFPTLEEALAALEERAAKQREAQARREDAARRKAAARAALAPGPLPPRLEGALNKSDELPGQWLAALTELLISSDGERHIHLNEETLAGLRGLVGSPLARRLVTVALEFLPAGGSIPDEPFAEGRTAWPVIFGFVAFAVIHELSPADLAAVKEATWRRWMRVLIGYRSVADDEGIHLALLQRAAAEAPDAAVDEVLHLLQRMSVEGERWLCDATGQLITTSPTIATRVLQHLAIGACPPLLTEQVLDLLVRSHVEGAVDTCRSLMQRIRSPEADDAERALAAYYVVLALAPATTWKDFWPQISSDDKFARWILENAARSRDYLPRDTWDGLAEAQLADFYLLLFRLYPPESDPWHVGSFSPGPRDNLRRWRDGLLNALEARKTEGAVVQLQRIAAHEPIKDYLVQVWLRAEAALRGERWRGTSPQEIVKLAEQRGTRLVESGTQLLDILEESIERFQHELQGELRSVVGLWNEGSGGNRPKPEAHLSNEITRHLRRDLVARQVVIGRELMMQVGIEDGAPGLRTDIDVVARAAPGSNRAIESIRAVIEVKGSWNAEVMRALKDQLVDRYLDPHHIRSGLYLVGWYTCGSWREGRDRRRSELLGDRETVQASLTAQAVGVTSSVREVRAFVLNVSLPDKAGPAAVPTEATPLVEIREGRRRSKQAAPKKRPHKRRSQGGSGKPAAKALKKSQRSHGKRRSD